jgi:hypothetical protein
VPNAADAFLALTSRSDGKVDFAALLSTIFSGQVQSQANAGTAGGTIYYVNLGGIKLAWGVSNSGLTMATTPVSYGFTLPTSFFSSLQAALVSAVPAVDGRVISNIGAASAAAVSANLWNPSNGAATGQVFMLVIGT